MAPGSSLLYISLTVRPQGAQRTQVETTLHKLFGQSADASIRKAVNGLFRKMGATYSGDVRPWLGQRVGIVFTQISLGAASGASKAGVAMIAPTQNPSAARSFVARLVRRNPGEEGKVMNGYAIFGGALAYQAILATSPGNSLAANPTYQATTSQVGSAPSALLYMNLHRFAQELTTGMPMAGAAAPLLRRSLARIGANAGVAAGLTLTPQAIRMDTVETGVRLGPHHAPVNVGNLPSGSWLAMATGAFNQIAQKQFRTGFELGLANALTHGAAGSALLQSAIAKRLAFLEQDVFPALGPISLAVGGSSPLNLTAGLKLTPGSSAAATRLLGVLRALVGRSPALQASGTATHFTVKSPTGSSLLVNQARGNVVATYGFPSQAAFLSPTAKLSQDQTFRQAASQLPAGSVPFYLSFPPIAGLVQLLDHKPTAAKTVRVLDKLNYLIAGGSQGHVRVVLGLR
jgi:hypothetical protein